MGYEGELGKAASSGKSEIVELDPTAWVPLPSQPPRWSRQEPLPAEKNARHLPSQHHDLALNKLSDSS